MIRGTARATVAGLALFGALVEPLVETSIGDGILPQGTAAADLVSAAVDRLVSTAAKSDASPRTSRDVSILASRDASTPGPVRRVDVNRIFDHVRQVLKNGLVDVQAKTLDAPFVAEAEELLHRAALQKWGRARFREAMESLAEEWGATNFLGSYADTWYQTIILNASYNKALRNAYSAEPTNRLFPFIAYRTMGDARVRAEHRALDGFVAFTLWPLWDLYTPPLGWNCRCRLVPVSYTIAKALGWIGQQFPRGTEFLAPRLEGDKVVKPGRSPGFSSPL